MSKTNLSEVQADQQQLEDDTDHTDSMGEILMVDAAAEDDELRPFALAELTVGHQSPEPGGDSVVWSSSGSRLRIEFSRLQVADRDLAAWCDGKVIALDDASDAPICLYVDGMLFGRGELVSQNNTIGVRITELFQSNSQEAA